MESSTLTDPHKKWLGLTQDWSIDGCTSLKHQHLLRLQAKICAMSSSAVLESKETYASRIQYSRVTFANLSPIHRLMTSYAL